MTRVVSALLLAALLLVCIWWLQPSATVVVAILAAGIAAFELANMIVGPGVSVATIVVAASAMMACASVSLVESIPAMTSSATLFWIGWPLVAVIAAVASRPRSASVVAQAGRIAMAPLYVGVPLGMLGWVRLHDGREALVLPILVIAASDSAQYYTGRLFGRHKLAPTISPKKTIEGAVGGLVVAAAVGAAFVPRLVAPALQTTVSAVTGAALAFALAVAGILGDLFESFLKRRAGVKDSSALIPGHGGLLDRIDSHLFAAPIYYVFLRYVA